MERVERVEVVVAHHECATLRVGDVFLKIDAHQARTDREVAAMDLVPVPTPARLWRRPPVLALAALRGRALGRLGQASDASSAAWVAAGAALRQLHDAPLPPWPGRPAERTVAHLDRECAWLVEHDVLPADVVRRNREIAEVALRSSSSPVFGHGDLQVAHVFVDGDEVTGIIDWTEAGPGDPLYDLACLTIVHQEHLDDLLRGYATDVDTDVIRAWWSLRSIGTIRWLVEHGIDPDPTAGVESRWPRSELDVLWHAAGVSRPSPRPEPPTDG